MGWRVSQERPGHGAGQRGSLESSRCRPVNRGRTRHRHTQPACHLQSCPGAVAHDPGSALVPHPTHPHPARWCRRRRRRWMPAPAAAPTTAAAACAAPCWPRKRAGWHMMAFNPSTNGSSNTRLQAVSLLHTPCIFPVCAPHHTPPCTAHLPQAPMSNMRSPRLREMRPVRTSSATPNLAITRRKASICVYIWGEGARSTAQRLRQALLPSKSRTKVPRQCRITQPPCCVPSPPGPPPTSWPSCSLPRPLNAPCPHRP